TPPTLADRLDEQTLNTVPAPRDTASIWPVAILVLWSIGALAMLGRICVGHVALGRIAADARPPADGRWGRLLDAERTRMGVGTTVRLLESGATTTPLTWGVRAPVILLPPTVRQWPDAKRRAVLRHELAHIARADASAGWLAALLCTMYWFHPLAWL